MTPWRSLDKKGKLAALDAVKAEHPDYTGHDIARELGISYSAVQGVYFRANRAVPHQYHQPAIGKNIHPLLRTIFETVQAWGMPDAELSETSGVPRERIWGYRSGVQEPRLSTLTKLAAALEIDLFAVHRRKKRPYVRKAEQWTKEELAQIQAGPRLEPNKLPPFHDVAIVAAK